MGRGVGRGRAGSVSGEERKVIKREKEGQYEGRGRQGVGRGRIGYGRENRHWPGSEMPVILSGTI